MNRKIAAVLLVIIIFQINVFAAAASENSDISIKMNGEALCFESNPQIVSGRTLVPVAALAKELGASVEWISDTKSVLITLQVRDSAKIIYLKIGQASALIDGIEVMMDVPAAIHNNRTYVPLRFIAEAFGAKANWDGKTRTVNIIYNIPHQEASPRLIPPWEVEK